ncbi:hypothetical protein C8Q76DRAFT_798940 [Earliella scabrosa]|nr:hypothetical protein C8Q76DRAFT_798940 [Earliella scabrosa]
MHFSTLMTIAGVALAAVSGVAAEEKRGVKTTWVPTATVTETHTWTATRIEQHWTPVPPYIMTTTFPITWTQVQTKTEYKPVVTTVPDRRHARDFQA